MSALLSISTEIIFKNVISYALKLFWDSWKQGYLSHVEVDIREKISQY